MKIPKKWTFLGLTAVLSAVLCLTVLCSAFALYGALSKDTEKTDLPIPGQDASLPEGQNPENTPQSSKKEPSENAPTTSETPDESAPIKEVWYYNGIRLGVKSEEHSKEDLLDALYAILPQGHEADGTLTVVKERSDLEALPLEEIAQKIAAVISVEYTEGCALYIKGILLAVSESKTVLENAIERFLAEQQLKDNQHSELRDVTFSSDFPVKKGKLMAENEVLALLGLCSHITLEKLPNVNYDTVDRFLEGADLPVLSPVIITEEEMVLTEVIPFATIEKQDASKYEGYRALERQGADGVRTLSYKVIFENGVEVSRVLLSNEVTTAPTEEIYIVGALKKGTATGSLMWPTTEGYISSQYGYRYLFGEYKLHGGLDIAIVTGTNLYAADGGTVIQAGDAGNTYGTYVIIDHGNGMKTLYAHMSKVSVKKGDLVNKGDLIGKSGATGRVTGPHLHFEVRIDGVRKDPADYLPAKR